MMEFDEIDDPIGDDISFPKMLQEVGEVMIKLISHIILVSIGLAGMCVVNGGSLSYENFVVLLLIMIYLQIVK